VIDFSNEAAILEIVDPFFEAPALDFLTDAWAIN
jgi:hypothetical protein